jgi:hypothetical protein
MVLRGGETSYAHTTKLSLSFGTPHETLDIGSDYGGGEFLDQLA